jgi:hypothetical protein
MAQAEFGARAAGLKDRRLDGQSLDLSDHEPVGVPRRIEGGPALADSALGADLKRMGAPLGPAPVEHDARARRPPLPGLDDRPQDVGPITPHDDEAISWLHDCWSSSRHTRLRLKWDDTSRRRRGANYHQRLPGGVAQVAGSRRPNEWHTTCRRAPRTRNWPRPVSQESADTTTGRDQMGTRRRGGSFVLLVMAVATGFGAGYGLNPGAVTAKLREPADLPLG